MISVIIPTYNCKGFVQKAIASVLNQTYKDVEIIVIDDGSTDGTFTELKSLNDRINYVWQENRGVSQARNVALGIARGTIIAFLDADDIWFREKLQVQIQFLERFSDVAGVFTDFSVVNPKDELLENRGMKKQYPIFKNYKMTMDKIFLFRDHLRAESLFDNQINKIDVYHGNIFKSLFLGNFIKTSSIVIRKEAIGDVGKFNPSLRTQEDYEYFLRLSEKFDLGYIDHPLVFIRSRPGQLTGEDQREEIARKSLEVIQRISSGMGAILSKKLLRRRLADKYRSLALVYLGKERNGEARSVIAESIRTYPFDLKTILLYCWCFIPAKLGIFLKDIAKHLLRMTR